jgi:acetyl esterase/lipase
MEEMARGSILVFALLLFASALHNKSARAQVMSVEDALKLPQPPPDHRIPYGDDPLQFADLRLPKGEGPHPVVIVIHGGCWRAQYNLDHISSFCAALTEAGVGGWPGTFQDVARGADHLRAVAQSYPLDLNQVVAVGHSAGGHLVAWLAARSRVPRESALYTEDPLSLRGVIPLAGVLDLRRAIDGGVCGEMTEQLLGGSPSEVPDRYRAGSPIELLPFGLPQRSIIGDKDDPALIGIVRHYDATAKEKGDDATLSILDGAGHFELVTPGSAAWPVVKDAVLSLVGSRVSGESGR